MISRGYLYFLLCLLTTQPLQAQQTIVLWHSFAGSLAQTLNRMASQFEQRHPDVHLQLVYKGNYIESLTSFAAAYQGNNPPDMVQVFEVGRDTMLAAKNAVIPVEKLLTQQAIDNILPSVKQYYSYQQQLMAYPMNVSVPVMYYNQTALANITADEPFPSTWQGIGKLLRKIRLAGYRCGYTSAFPAWLQLESFASLHGKTLMAEHNLNQVRYIQPAIVHHLKRLKRWQQDYLFTYGGRDSDATHLFTSGTCILFSQSSGAWQSLNEMAPFKVGIAPMPIDKEATSLRHTNTFGGAALWVLKTRDPDKLAAIQAWLKFLSAEKTQLNWYQQTGYLPMLKNNPLIKQSKLLQIAEKDLVSASPSLPVSRGPQNQFRTILDQMLERLFSQSISVEKALLFAEKQANYRLRRFQKNYGIKSDN